MPRHLACGGPAGPAVGQHMNVLQAGSDGGGVAVQPDDYLSANLSAKAEGGCRGRSGADVATFL